MKVHLSHIGINVSSHESLQFWREFLVHLEFQLADDGDHFDADDGRTYLCVNLTAAKHKSAGFHRKQTGLNHLAFQVASRQDVDQFVADFLEPHAITPLYSGAKAYPDYSPEYYAVYFEDPDRIKVEIVFEGRAL